MAELILSEHLLDYLDDYCARRAGDCPVKCCDGTSDCRADRMSLTLIAPREADPGFVELRRSVRDLECRQCSLLLVLRAVDRTVPREKQAAWLDRPSFDLRGATPRAALEQGNHEGVINALWLYDNTDYICS
jgi:hypothetical protein